MQTKPDVVLAIDAGTSSVKVGLVSIDGTVHETASVPYRFTTPAEHHVEIDFEDVWKGLIKAVRELPAADYRVHGIGLSVMRPVLLCLDSEGTPLRPAILYLDRRSIGEAKRILQQVGEKDLLSMAGNLPYPGSLSMTNMLWVKNHEPEIYKRTAFFGHTNTFLLHRLTGEWAFDPTNASYTGLYFTTTCGGWNTDLARDIGIAPEKLPPLVPSFQPAGGLLPETARKLGIPAGIPVVPGSGDSGAAALGAGVNEEGEILNSTGTVEVMVLATERPVPSPDYLIATHPLPNRWLIMNIIPSGGCALEWVRREMYREIEKDRFYSDLLPRVLGSFRAAGIPGNFGSSEPSPSSAALHAEPFFAGDRNSFEQRSASFSGIGLGSTRDDMLRATAEGILREMRRRYDFYLRHWEPAGRIHYTGGGAAAMMKLRKKFFPEMEWLPVEHATLKGAAALAWRGVKGS